MRVSVVAGIRFSFKRLVVAACLLPGDNYLGATASPLSELANGSRWALVDRSVALMLFGKNPVSARYVVITTYPLSASR
jgi:hypothetical protein